MLHCLKSLKSHRDPAFSGRESVGNFHNLLEPHLPLLFKGITLPSRQGCCVDQMGKAWNIDPEHSRYAVALVPGTITSHYHLFSVMWAEDRKEEKRHSHLFAGRTWRR